MKRKFGMIALLVALVVGVVVERMWSISYKVKP